MARQRKLSPERKAFIGELLEHYQPSDAADVQDMLKDLLGDTLQEMLVAEMDQHLGYTKYDYRDKKTTDSRNGFSKKTVTSSMGLSLWIFPETERVHLSLRLLKRMKQISPASKIRYYQCTLKE